MNGIRAEVQIPQRYIDLAREYAALNREAFLCEHSRRATEKGRELRFLAEQLWSDPVQRETAMRVAETILKQEEATT